jgi:predicted dehydrogenase
MARRLLLTGRGSIAQRHLRHWREFEPAGEVAVVAPGGAVDPSMQPCTVVTDLSEGLAWGPDAVIIASVSSRHAGELEACLRAGLPVLAEKPVVISREELERLRLAAEAAANASAVLVGCNLRYLPVLRSFAARLREPDAGRLVRASLEVGQYLPQWRPARSVSATYSADAAQGGGVVFDLVHEIDMARVLLGELRVRSAAGGHLSSLPIAADDVHVALLLHASGAPVTVSLDYVSRRAVRRYEAVTEGGTLSCDILARRMRWAGPQGDEDLEVPADAFDVAATYRLQMQDWLAAMDHPGHTVASPLQDALASAELMLAMKEAAACA